MDTTPRFARRPARIAWLSAILVLGLTAACGTTAQPASPAPTAATASAAVPPTPVSAPPTRPPATLAPPVGASPAPAPTPSATPSPPAMLADVYLALRPQHLRPAVGDGTFVTGTDAAFAFELVNASPDVVRLPEWELAGQRARWIGRLQAWVRPLDRGVDLSACLPGAARRGAWYGVVQFSRDGWLDAQPATLDLVPADGRVLPGQGATRSIVLPGQATRCFPPGRYRYQVEYLPFDGEAGESLAATSADVKLVRPASWSLLLLGGVSGSATLRLDGRGRAASTALDLTGLAPGTALDARILVAADDGTGPTIVGFPGLVAGPDGAIHARDRVELTRAARRALRGGDTPAVELTLGGSGSWTRMSPDRAAAASAAAPTLDGRDWPRDRIGGITVRASSQTVYGRPGHAVDGHGGNMWNSGGYPPAWIELDLGRNRAVTALRLLPSQSPGTAATIHRIWGRADGSRREVLLRQLDGTTSDNTWIEVSLSSAKRVRYLRIETVESPSWVAWREVQVLGRGLPPASAPLDGTHDGWPQPFAVGDECRAEGWVADPDDPARSVRVRVLVDGAVVATGVAGLSRPDVASAGFGAGRSGFSIGLRSLVGLGVHHEVRVQGQDVETGRWVDLVATPRTLTCN